VTAGRSIPNPGFAGDDGRPDPALDGALQAVTNGTGSVVNVLSALTTARLFVPVVALLEGVEDDPATGLAREKRSAMATVTVLGSNGRRAMLAFTGVKALRAWREDARPVAVTAQQAAAAAMQEGADALALDFAGSPRYVITGRALHGLAAGYRVTTQRDGSAAWVVPIAGGTVSRRPDP
jgi:hypothetical protein